MFFTVVGPNIRFGLGAVKGVGESAIESILDARRRVGRFGSLLQFCEEVDLHSCNKKVLEALIKSGSFDFIGTTRKAIFDQLEATADSAQRIRDEKERGQSSLFGTASSSNRGTTASGAEALSRSPIPPAPDWPEEEMLRYEKETLGFYVSGHPLNRYGEETRLFATPEVTTETLSQHIDETVNIAGIVSQIKRTKIKKGQNEGKLMAKFVLEDQHGSVEVVVFSDVFAKYARWLDNGVPVLLTAAVRDTGGMSIGRSASLQSAEQSAQHIDDEYGGHPEARGRASAYIARGPKISYYEVGEDGVDDDRDPKEIERERYGDRTKNLDLFGRPVTPLPAGEGGATRGGAPGEGRATRASDDDRNDNGAVGVRTDVALRQPKDAAVARAVLAEADAFNDATANVAEDDDLVAPPPVEEALPSDAPDDEPAIDQTFAAHAAAFHEAPITPELNALEIIPLDGIRDKKVREIVLEVPYARMTEEIVKRIREIVEAHLGEIPLSITLTDLPKAVAAERGELRLKISHHFRVEPGPALSAALLQVHAVPKYVF
jgi:hypothetical protein